MTTRKSRPSKSGAAKAFRGANTSLPDEGELLDALDRTDLARLKGRQSMTRRVMPAERTHMAAISPGRYKTVAVSVVSREPLMLERRYDNGLASMAVVGDVWGER